jgi:predicted RNA-binding Zn-ribbon protein involved in translation (DUF1610 family)
VTETAAERPAAPHAESCLICGGPLEYLDAAADVTCSLCGTPGRGHVRCLEHHYVCESCHGAGFMAQLPALLAVAAAEGDASPFHIADRLMDHPDLPMLGCEHAHIAAGALMTALRVADVAGVTEAHTAEALERTSQQAVSAYCGLTGVCGVVPALGACYSVLVGGQCGRGPQTKAVMNLVSRLAAATAAEAEPGCCKAYVRVGLREAVAALQTDVGITLPESESVACEYFDRHPHGCRGPSCEWHPGHTTISEEIHMPTTGPAAKARYDDFFSLAYADGALSAKSKILIALGASLASGCAP